MTKVTDSLKEAIQLINKPLLMLRRESRGEVKGGKGRREDKLQITKTIGVITAGSIDTKMIIKRNYKQLSSYKFDTLDEIV